MQPISFNQTANTPALTASYTYEDDLLIVYNGIVKTYDAVGNLLPDETWPYTWLNGQE